MKNIFAGILSFKRIGRLDRSPTDILATAAVVVVGSAENNRY
jgi:hypothetical protein